MVGRRLLAENAPLLPDRPGTGAFLHPGMLHSRAELEFIRKKIDSGKKPWRTEWETMRASDAASLKYKPNPRPEVVRGPYNNPNIGSSEMTRDSVAAYTQALMWCLTGKSEHAKISIAILNAWSETLKKVSGHDTLLLIGMVGVRLCNAAELIRHTGAGWEKSDQRKFENLLRERFYPSIKDFYPSANGNWDASMIQTMLAMGIFLDDRPMFNRAADYCLRGQGNGSIRNYVNSFGESQESGRDQAHTQMGLGFLGCACEMAWKQGVDLYGAEDNRLAAGFEYTAKYNLGHEVRYEPYRSIDGRYNYRSISKDDRGRFAPIYERVVYHYHHRLGLEMPWSRAVVAKNVPERRTGNGGHVPWGRLMFAGLPEGNKRSDTK